MEQTKTQEEVQKPTVEKTPNLGRCHLIRTNALAGVKNRDELALKVFNTLKKANKLQTKKGAEITVDTIKSQISSVVTVIKKGIQKHWKAFKVVETEKSFKFVKKASN